MAEFHENFRLPDERRPFHFRRRSSASKHDPVTSGENVDGDLYYEYELGNELQTFGTYDSSASVTETGDGGGYIVDTRMNNIYYAAGAETSPEKQEQQPEEAQNRQHLPERGYEYDGDYSWS